MQNTFLHSFFCISTKTSLQSRKRKTFLLRSKPRQHNKFCPVYTPKLRQLYALVYKKGKFSALVSSTTATIVIRNPADVYRILCEWVNMDHFFLTITQFSYPSLFYFAIHKLFLFSKDTHFVTILSLNSFCGCSCCR